LQAPFSCTPDTIAEIEQALSPARIARFLPAAKGDVHLALRLYIWNARLCEELYLPLQTAEVLVRNAIAETLKRRYGRGWYSKPAVHALLPQQQQKELDALVRREQLDREILFSGDHVVAGLSFGFWVNWLTASYQHHIWQLGVQRSFPHAPAGTTRNDAHQRIDRLRRFRNLVMHHRAIFDRNPIAEHQNLVEVVSWVSPATRWLLNQLRSPARIVNSRPRV
jgi:hypothetical protein